MKEIITKAVSRYIETYPLRAAIQVIPYIGGAIDTLIVGKGQEIQLKRIEHFLSEIDKRMRDIEFQKVISVSEEFYDLFSSALEGAIKTRSHVKQEGFARIVCNQVVKDLKWEEAETVTRLLRGLDEIHIRVLIEIMSAPVCDAPFHGLRAVTLKDKPHGDENVVKALGLQKKFPDLTLSALRMVCSELISKSLIYDEGVGRVGTKSMEYFVATDLANWFTDWIAS